MWSFNPFSTYWLPRVLIPLSFLLAFIVPTLLHLIISANAWCKSTVCVLITMFSGMIGISINTFAIFAVPFVVISIVVNSQGRSLGVRIFKILSGIACAVFILPFSLIFLPGLSAPGAGIAAGLLIGIILMYTFPVLIVCYFGLLVFEWLENRKSRLSLVVPIDSQNISIPTDKSVSPHLAVLILNGTTFLIVIFLYSLRFIFAPTVSDISIAPEKPTQLSLQEETVPQVKKIEPAGRLIDLNSQYYVQQGTFSLVQGEAFDLWGGRFLIKLNTIDANGSSASISTILDTTEKEEILLQKGISTPFTIYGQDEYSNAPASKYRFSGSIIFNGVTGDKSNFSVTVDKGMPEELK